MELLKQMALAFLMVIRIGVVCRIVHSCIMIGASEDEAPRYKKRIRNALVFYICAELVWQLKDIIMTYYK